MFHLVITHRALLLVPAPVRLLQFPFPEMQPAPAGLDATSFDRRVYFPTGFRSGLGRRSWPLWHPLCLFISALQPARMVFGARPVTKASKLSPLQSAAAEIFAAARCSSFSNRRSTPRRQTFSCQSSSADEFSGCCHADGRTDTSQVILPAITAPRPVSQYGIHSIPFPQEAYLLRL